MAGLLLKLSPREKYYVNGALLENGDRPNTIRVMDNNARILRYSDALLPNEVDTPVRRVYYAVQLLITGDLDAREVLPAIDAECAHLESVFEPFNAKPISLVRNMVCRGNYYSAIIQLRRIFPLEARLLNLAETRNSSGPSEFSGELPARLQIA